MSQCTFLLYSSDQYQNLTQQISILQTEKKKTEEEFSLQRAKMKDLILQKEGKFSIHSHWLEKKWKLHSYWKFPHQRCQYPTIEEQPIPKSTRWKEGCSFMGGGELDKNSAKLISQSIFIQLWSYNYIPKYPSDNLNSSDGTLTNSTIILLAS